MNKLPLLNIGNVGSTIYLFCRDKEGKPFIQKDELFKPYYYEPSTDGVYKGYGGISLKKIVCKKPYEVAQQRTNQSYESDIIYTVRYMIDNVEIIKTPIRWMMLDIEVQTGILPDVTLADKPISCVSIYDNFDNKGMTFWLPNYKSEFEMAERIAKYIKERQPDLILAWNGENFDYPYMIKRWPDFAKQISPIGEVEYHNGYPMGISLVDLYCWDKKMTLNRRKQYTLDFVAEEETGMKSLPKVNFNSLDIAVRDKNIYDLKRMIAIEKKKQYIPLFNDIRILSKCLWSDMEFNSKLIDKMLLQEAKTVGIILPKKVYAEERQETEEDDFEGAYRECFKTGLLKDISAYDLSGAYLNVIADLCLDASNIGKEFDNNILPIRITDRVSNEIKKTLYIKQNSNAILPRLVKKLIQDKIKYKKEKDEQIPNTKEAKEADSKYNAEKSLVLSSWGCIGNKGFRLHNADIAGAITATVRDLIHYVKDELKKQGKEIVYIDTDSCLIADNGKDNSIFMNSLIQKWSQERFKKPSSIVFEHQGNFKKLFLIAMCHYSGQLETKNGIKLEEKGLELKKKDATPFMAETQRTAINMVFDEKTENDIIDYKNKRIKEIESASLFDIALPNKIAANKEYKNEPIHARALRYAKEEGKLQNIKPGDLFYWIYVNSFGTEEKLSLRKIKVTKKELKGGINSEWTKNSKGDYFKMANKSTSKEKDVMAFTEDEPLDSKYKVNMEKMIERNITKKLDAIICALQGETNE